MALSSSRPQHLLRRFHASAQALSRVDPHEHSQPSGYLGSWGESAPATGAAGGGDTRQAWARLERLRKGYARDVGKLRRQYAYEAQLLEAERQRKAEARAEAVRVANEERKAAKAAAAQTRAAERRAFELDFRQALVIRPPHPSYSPARTVSSMHRTCSTDCLVHLALMESASILVRIIIAFNFHTIFSRETKAHLICL
jgi:hypothetical protein